MNESAPHPVYTIGYAGLEFNALIDILKRHHITAVADVRSDPYSKRQAEFSYKNLPGLLKVYGITYVYLGRELGGRRQEPECYTMGQVDYRKVTALPLFQEGIERLIKGARKMTLALLCAETDPLGCHRGILISPLLQARGLEVRHLTNTGRIELHTGLEKRLFNQQRPQTSLFDTSLKEAYVQRARQIAFRREGK